MLKVQKILIQIIIFLLFIKVMTQILAGSAFGQVFTLPLDVSKAKQKIFQHGIMKKQRIRFIQLSSKQENSFYFSSEKNIYLSTYQDSTEHTVFSNAYAASKIIGIYEHQGSIFCGLNNGSFVLISKNSVDQSLQYTSEEILVSKFQPGLDKTYNKLIQDGKGSFCMVGKDVLPFLYDSNKSLVVWNGKNVPNDQLDLRVPVNDVDATFFKDSNHLACAHASNKVRIYDVRSNKQKPSADYHLKLDKVYNKSYLTKILVNPQQQHLFYLGNDLGAVYECDIRKSMLVVGKFKSINSSITDLKIHEENLFTSSLDCYVRSFNLQSKELLQKFYMNKPVYSIQIRQKAKQQVNQYAQEVLSQADEQQINPPQAQQKKVKKLRKRNKINLKYLKPVNWDDVPIDQELLKQAKQQYEQINAKDADSYLDQEEQQVKIKDQHDSDRDSDID